MVLKEERDLPCSLLHGLLQMRKANVYGWGPKYFLIAVIIKFRFLPKQKARRCVSLVKSRTSGRNDRRYRGTLKNKKII